MHLRGLAFSKLVQVVHSGWYRLDTVFVEWPPCLPRELKIFPFSSTLEAIYQNI